MSQNLQSQHTTNFPNILRQLNISLVVSTYQAGKLITVRPDLNNADTLNTSFQSLSRPMGMYADGNRLVVGTQGAIVEYVNAPELKDKLEPKGVNDACYIYRKSHTTGDIDIHEMEFLNDKLWFLNTRFSALCTLEGNHSFVPKWKPKFISKLANEDRCHLNGLCSIDGKIKYVTALGQTDEALKWKENKRDGGVLIDIENDEIILDKLSMPHSPRFYNGKLWLLESGTGSFGYVDLEAKKYIPISFLDGFTRGVSFIANVVFIGISKIREKSTFNNLPIVDKLREKERICGVYVVDINSGKTLAFLNFIGDIEEIFSVSIIPNSIYPEILDLNTELLHNTYSVPTESVHLF